MHFNKKFSLDVESRKQRENALASGFPHFSGQSETRLKVSEEESGHFFFISGFLKTVVKFSLCFGPGKVSLQISFSYFQCSENNVV